MTIYFDLIIEDKTFYIKQSENKPQAKGSALAVLLKIEMVIENDFQYAGEEQQDEFTDLSKDEVYDRLREKALEIHDAYCQRVAKISWIGRKLTPSGKQRKEVKAVYQRIAPPEVLPFPNEIIQLIGSYLDAPDLAHFAQLNAHGQSHARVAFLPKARAFGYEGNADVDEARDYLHALFLEVKELSQKGVIPKKYVVNKGSIPGFRHVDADATLLQLKELSLEDLSKIFSNKKLYEISHQKFTKFLLTLTEEGVVSEIEDDELQSKINEACLLAAQQSQACKEVFELLIAHGADIEAHTSWHATVLSLATTYAKEEVVRFLIEKGANLDILSIYSRSLVINAAFRPNILQILFDHGLDCNHKDQYGKTALHYAAQKNKLEAVKCLLENGADANDGNNNGYTALHYAAKNYNTQIAIVTLLLKHGANPLIRDNSGNTAFRLIGHVCEIGEFLDIFNPDSAGNSLPLHMAVKKGRIDILELLLERGEDIDAPDAQLHTPLKYAVFFGKEEIVKWLISKGASLDIASSQGYTPFMYATRYPKILKILLENGAQVNHASNAGNTTLHYAANHGRLESVKLLLEYGADPTIQNAAGETAADLAEKHGYTTLARHLRTIYFDLEISENTFCIKQSRIKPQEKGFALSVLDKIEMVIRNDFEYASELEDDEFSDLSKEEVYALLRGKALEIHDAYYERVSKVPWIARKITRASKQQKKVEAVYNRIEYLFVPPEVLPLPSELIQLLGNFLDVQDLAHVAQLNTHGQSHADAGFLSRAREYGYEGNGDIDEIRKYLDALHVEVKELYERGLIPKKCLVYRGRIPGFRKINIDATLRRLKRLTAEDLINIFLDKGFYKISYQKCTKYLLKLTREEIISKTSDEALQAKANKAFLLAARKSKACKEVFALLLAHGADIDTCDSHQQTALSWASRYGTEEVVCFLIEQGSKLDTINVLGQNFLIHASDRPKILQILLEHGPDVHHADNKGQTALHWAAEYGCLGAVKLLLEHGANIEATTQTNSTPLAKASCYGKKSVAAFLIEQGANIDAANLQGMTPLLWAAKRNRLKTLQLLLEKGANVNHAKNSGWTALHFAANKGSLAAVKLLIKHGANPLLQNNNGHTAYNKAQPWGYNGKILQILRVFNPDNTGYSLPLHYAAQYGYKDVVKLLLQRGEDINTPNTRLLTPLAIAGINGREKIVKLLIDQGAIVDTENAKGNTPLINATKYPKILKILLENGAEIDHANNNGYTALHFAAKYGRLESVELLLENGADASLHTFQEETAVDLAEKKGHRNIIHLFQEDDQEDDEVSTPSLFEKFQSFFRMHLLAT